MLQVNFNIDDKTLASVEKASKDTSIAVIPVVIENEAMRQLGDTIPSSSSLAGDLEKARSVLAAAGLQAAYLVVYGSMQDPVTIVVYTSDASKAKERMLYSAGAAHLRELVNQRNTIRRTPVQTVQAASVEDIQPRIFQRKEDAAGREALMTESERQRAEIAKMPVAPQPTAMPGVKAPLSSEAEKVLQLFATTLAAGGGMVVTFKIESNNDISVDKHETAAGVSEKNEQLELAASLLPASEPRYVLTDYCEGAGKGRAAVMCYVCPGSCPPRQRMSYASSKASFVAQLAQHNIAVARREEAGSAEEMVDVVREAFTCVDYGGEGKGTQGADKKPPGARGPRMLI